MGAGIIVEQIGSFALYVLVAFVLADFVVRAVLWFLGLYWVRSLAYRQRLWDDGDAYEAASWREWESRQRDKDEWAADREKNRRKWDSAGM